MLDKVDTLIAFAVIMLGVSLIITILTQMAAGFLALRGSNLLWGVETLLKELDPQLEVNLKAANSSVLKLAEEILTDPLISDSTFSRAGEMWIIGPVFCFLSRLPVASWLVQRWRYATAIRPDELARMLGKKAASLAMPAAAAAGSVNNSQAVSGSAAAAISLSEILTAPDPETIRRLKQLNSALCTFARAATSQTGTTQEISVQVDKVFQRATDAAQGAVGKLENSFNGVMDRVSQRFALEMRLWTVGFAFLVAFGAHLDSFRLLDQLSTNADVRSALAHMRDSMLTEANTVLPQPGAAQGSPEVPVSTKVLNEALDQLKGANSGLTGVPPIPENTTTVGDAVAWLTAQPGGAGQSDAYRRTVVRVLHAHAVDIGQQLAKSGVELVPTPYPGVFTYGNGRNLLGILIAAALLSLGAPFWYNALKNLSDLRAMVSSEQDDTAN
uniref:Uncharacterized protein n=1 Tax=Solibacter usitatus (strain Ellin6076) TaxID=234267 RepID=Q01W82_SOLUE